MNVDRRMFHFNIVLQTIYEKEVEDLHKKMEERSKIEMKSINKKHKEKQERIRWVLKN